MKKLFMKQINRDTQILAHMYKYCEKVVRTVSRFGNDFETFLNDDDFRDSVSMNMLQIGELVPKLSNEFIEETSSIIPWRDIKCMRNFFAHDYGSMNTEIIWNTALNDIPALQKFCKSYAEEYQQACDEIEDEDETQDFNQMM